MKPIYFMGHLAEGCALPPHSKADWERVLIACHFRCFYCNTVLDFESATKDHLVPLFRRGCDCVGNLVSSCRRCNSMKKEKTVAEFLHMKPALVETSGRFYTRITSLKALLPAAHDPLLNAVARLARQKSFPATMETYRVPESPSWAWRNPAC